MTLQSVVGLGCRLNIAESERIAALLGDRNDIVVVNSCSVTGEAVRQTRKVVRQLRRERPDARLLVTGCAAETERDALIAMPEVDGLVANARKLDGREYGASETASALPSQRTRAFVAIQNGCDHSCTFCIIPQGRGASRSVAIADALRAIERHLAQGAGEIVLTGVDVTSWGSDLAGQPRLGALVAAILNHFPTLPRLRLSSLDGAEIDPELFELIAGEARVMPHLHLSLQHGDDLILKRMKRRHSRADAIALVQALKARRPEIAIGADLIAGFPTESGAHHAQNLSLVEECDIVHGHVFPYSPRHDTPAARMPQVPPPLAHERAADLRAAIAGRRAAWLRSLVGRPQSVLAERGGTGYGPSYARIRTLGIASGTITTITPTRLEDDILT